MHDIIASGHEQRLWQLAMPCACVCMRVCLRVCVCICVHVCICACMRARMLVCMCVHVCMHACMYLCVYACTCMHTRMLQRLPLALFFSVDMLLQVGAVTSGSFLYFFSYLTHTGVLIGPPISFPLQPHPSLPILSPQFFEHAEHIFNACDMEGKGLVDREVFFSIIRQMNQTPSDIQHQHEV